MKQILTAALLLLAMTASAQKNPMRGYVVTLQNDTLRGTVDYLSGTKNAWTCLFRRDGETEFKTYTPQDIKGYRLTDNGAYNDLRNYEQRKNDYRTVPRFAKYYVV